MRQKDVVSWGGLASAVSSAAMLGLSSMLARGPCQQISQALSGVLQYVPGRSSDKVLHRDMPILECRMKMVQVIPSIVSDAMTVGQLTKGWKVQGLCVPRCPCWVGRDL